MLSTSFTWEGRQAGLQDYLGSRVCRRRSQTAPQLIHPGVEVKPGILATENHQARGSGVKGEAWKQSSWIPQFMLSGQIIQKINKTRFHLATTKPKHNKSSAHGCKDYLHPPSPDETRCQHPSNFRVCHSQWKFNCASLTAFWGSHLNSVLPRKPVAGGMQSQMCGLWKWNSFSNSHLP